MKRKVFSIIAGVIAVVGILFWGVGHAYRSPERRMAWIAKRLNLDEQQKLKLEAVHEAMHQAREQFHQERAGLFEEIAAQIQSDRLDEAKLPRPTLSCSSKMWSGPITSDNRPYT
jgi:hypothetical protein